MYLVHYQSSFNSGHMIQRVQTLWLILAVIAATFSIKYPFYSGSLPPNFPYFRLSGTDSLPILIPTAISIVLSVFTIFSYKKRGLQTTLTIANILVSMVILVLYFSRVRDFASGSFSLTCVFALALPICLIMALRGIRRDSKLVKSLDRLR
jgi:hypothetical protein